MVVAFKRPFGLCRIGSSVQRFASDESGAVLAFVLPLFLMMVVVSGGAVDFMRQEVERARLQDGLDRGVLAAAAFGQGLEAEDTVAAYLASARVPANVVLAVGRDDAENSRRVSAQAPKDREVKIAATARCVCTPSPSCRKPRSIAIARLNPTPIVMP